MRPTAAVTAVLLCVGLAVLSGVCGLALAAPDTPAVNDAVQARARIAAERQRLQALLDAERAACRQRFAVSACIDAAEQRFRDGMAGTRQREQALDDVDRQHRAAERRAAVAEKQRLAAAAVAASASAPQAQSVQAPPSAASAAQPGVQRRPPKVDRQAGRQDPAAAAARQRAIASAQRRQKFQAEQDKVAQRKLDKAGQKSAAAPLPVPGKAATSAASAPP